MAALIVIVLASFYHVQLSDLFFMTPASEVHTYGLAMFWAAAIGGWGVVLTVLGFALSPRKDDPHVRIMPIFIGIITMIFLFFFLLSHSFDASDRNEQRRLRPGETITI